MQLKTSFHSPMLNSFRGASYCDFACFSMRNLNYEIRQMLRISFVSSSDEQKPKKICPFRFFSVKARELIRRWKEKMFRTSMLAFLMMLFFLYLAADARPLPESLPNWLTPEQQEQFYLLVLQAQESSAARQRESRYREQQIFLGRETNDLSLIFEKVFPKNRDQIQIHDDGARTGKIVFEGAGVEGQIQIVFDPLASYVRIRRKSLFGDWVYYGWQKGKLRNICRLSGGFSTASHVRVKSIF